jgi:hypothetical protein
MKTKLLILLSAVTLVAGNINVSRAGDDNDIATIADVTLVRPGCFLATVLGSAVFVVALPIAAISHSVGSTADTLVVAPAQATFTRPLGDFTSLQE